MGDHRAPGRAPSGPSGGRARPAPPRRATHRVAAALAAVLVTLGVGPPGVAAASPAPTVPRLLTCAGAATIRPSSYLLSCVDGRRAFEGIHWTSWTATSAAATATLVQNTCVPSCARGTLVRHPVTLTLAGPTPTSRGLLFHVLRYRIEAAGPFLLPLAPAPTRPRCAPDPVVAAAYVIPPAPFAVRDVTVQPLALPPSEHPVTGVERLYRVRFFVVRGNPVLAGGHAYAQFAYVARAVPTAPWCFLKGGSGP